MGSASGKRKEGQIQHISQVPYLHPLFLCYNTCEAHKYAQSKKEGDFLKKADFIKAVAAKTGTTQKNADAVVAAALDTIRETLKNGVSKALWTVLTIFDILPAMYWKGFGGF